VLVPTLCVVTRLWTLRVRCRDDAERQGMHSHAERGNDHGPAFSGRNAAPKCRSALARDFGGSVDSRSQTDWIRGQPRSYRA
jgi:hypothetical protein